MGEVVRMAELIARDPLTARHAMPADGIWPGIDHLGHY